MIRIRCIALLLLVCTGFAWAGSLGIAPVRIDLSDSKTTATVQVTNTGDEPMTIQVHGANWRTEGLEESYFDTNELVVNPPVFTLPVGEKQIIRLGLRRQQRTAIEHSYRLILEEVPKPAKAGTIATILRFTLPVFETPVLPVAPMLTWKATFDVDGALRLRVENHGTAHDRIKELALDSGLQKIKLSQVAYVLPGGWREFVIRDQRLKPANHITVEVSSDAGIVREDLNTGSN